jgi:hypothetical protein
MEYLVVHFSEDRGVIINGAPTAWRTNQTIVLQAATNFITLTPPGNFTPTRHKVVLGNPMVPRPGEIVLRNTLVNSPGRIMFTKLL